MLSNTCPSISKSVDRGVDSLLISGLLSDLHPTVHAHLELLFGGRSRPPAARTRGRTTRSALSARPRTAQSSATADEGTMQMARAFADCARPIEEIVYSG